LVDRVDPRRDREVAAVPVGLVHAVTAVGRLDVREDGVDADRAEGLVDDDTGAGASRPHVSQ
jgi:hypothetical protein